MPLIARRERSCLRWRWASRRALKIIMEDVEKLSERQSYYRLHAPDERIWFSPRCRHATKWETDELRQPEKMSGHISISHTQRTWCLSPPVNILHAIAALESLRHMKECRRRCLQENIMKTLYCHERPENNASRDAAAAMLTSNEARESLVEIRQRCLSREKWHKMKQSHELYDDTRRQLTPLPPLPPRVNIYTCRHSIY